MFGFISAGCGFDVIGFDTIGDSTQIGSTPVTAFRLRKVNNAWMTPESLGKTVADFLEGSRAAVVVEDGVIAFDLAESKYSISGEYNKQASRPSLWSNERNVVRRVLDAEIKGATLRLQVQRMGQNRPTRARYLPRPGSAAVLGKGGRARVSYGRASCGARALERGGIFRAGRLCG